MNSKFTPLMSNFIDFNSLYSTKDDELTNFIDEGSSFDEEFKYIYLQKEFDKSLTSFLDFSNPETLKAVGSSFGLEEFRFIVHYQMMSMQTF